MFNVTSKLVDYDMYNFDTQTPVIMIIITMTVSIFLVQVQK